MPANNPSSSRPDEQSNLGKQRQNQNPQPAQNAGATTPQAPSNESSRQAATSGGAAKPNQGSQPKKQDQDSPTEQWQGNPAGDSSSQDKSQNRRQAANIPDSDDDLDDDAGQSQRSAPPAEQ